MTTQELIIWLNKRNDVSPIEQDSKYLYFDTDNIEVIMYLKDKVIELQYTEPIGHILYPYAVRVLKPTN